MKIFHSEYKSDYSTYTFSYAIYCLAEEPNEFAQIYNQGFLPYTANYEQKKNIFYLARSLRVNLAHFQDTSENKRINRKVEELEITMRVCPKDEFDPNDRFLAFCGSFAEERFSGSQKSEDRLKYILTRDVLTHIISFSSKEKPLGYVYASLSGGMLHYWFAFYDTAFLRSHSLGKWMMWKVISWAKEEGLQYAYLGTCYGSKALYKARNHKGVEFYDGQSWNSDIKLLKHLCRLDDDDSSPSVDVFKRDNTDPESAIFNNLSE